MPHDPARIAEVHAWLAKAADFERTAVPPLASDIVFHEALLRTPARLTKYARKYRYPGEPEPPSIEEMDAALSVARHVIEAICKPLPSETRP